MSCFDSADELASKPLIISEAVAYIATSHTTNDSQNILLQRHAVTASLFGYQRRWLATDLGWSVV